jgi:biopolymer transport protein ExbB
MRFAAFIATLLITLPAQAWWDNDWGCRKKITISGTDATGVQGAHTDFPILFNTTDPNFGAGAQASGNDLAFVDSDDTSQLKHEVERWVNGTGEFIAWVKVPSLPDAGKDIYIYYCNDSVGAQEDPTNVWDSNFKGVWHMDTNVDSTTGPVTCTNNGVSFTSVKIGNGTTHDHAGSGDYFDCGAERRVSRWRRGVLGPLPIISTLVLAGREVECPITAVTWMALTGSSCLRMQAMMPT